MRVKYAAYLSATGLFVLVSVTDTLFALPAEQLHDNRAEIEALEPCKKQSGMPLTVASTLERANGEVPMLTPAKVWRNLACSLTGN